MRKSVFLFMFICAASFAQKNINNYKYIIVPNKFDFLKEADKYQTSSLTKFLLNKEGLVAFLDNEKLPLNIRQNRCLTLDANIKDLSGMFSTKVVLEIKDCNRNIIYTSAEGTSRSKEFKKGYQEAIRNAFKSLHYIYQPLEKEKIKQTENNEIEDDNTPVFKTTNVSLNDGENTSDKDKIGDLSVLYAKAVKEGYVLINEKKEPVFALLQTKLDKVFVIKNKNGLLYKNKQKGWIAEFYDVYGTKVLKNYEIKFSSNN